MDEFLEKLEELIQGTSIRANTSYLVGLSEIYKNVASVKELKKLNKNLAEVKTAFVEIKEILDNFNSSK